MMVNCPERLPVTLYKRALESSVVHPGVTTQSPGVGFVLLSPINVPSKLIVTHFCFEITVAGGANTKFRCGIYDRDHLPSPQGANLLWDSGDQNANVTGDIVIPVTPNLVLYPGIYWCALVFDNVVSTFRAFQYNGVFNDARDGCDYVMAYGSLSNPCPAVILTLYTAKIGLLVDVPKNIEEALTPAIGLNTLPHHASVKRYLACVESSLVHGTMATQVATANRVYLTPLQVTRQIRVEEVGFEVTTVGGVDSNLRIGIYDKYTNVADDPQGARLLWDSGAQAANFATAQSYRLISPLILRPGLYWLALQFDNAINAFRQWSNQNVFNSKLDGSRYDAGAFVLRDPCPATTRSITASPKMAIYGSQ